ncbi:MAG: hypothetical protein ABTD50_19335 [Polyangiaceae bacterium]|jgi:hypothetical protein
MSAPESKPELPEDVAIEAGKAQLVVFEALSELTGAVVRLERIVLAVARRLDETSKTREPRT